MGGIGRKAAVVAGVVAAAVMLSGATRALAAGWNELVAAANAEGEVDVHGGPGKLYEQVLT